MFALTHLIRQAAMAGAVLLFAIAGAAPAQAGVIMAFWSQDTGAYFPHAFFTLRGNLDRGGPPVDTSYGFTVKAVTPAILLTTVAGRIDETERSYIKNSNVFFELEITDAQYDSVMSLVEEWGENGNNRYNLNRRNCVHFIAEAARRAGLDVTEPKELMKKPRSFTEHVAAANRGSITMLNMPAEEYWATLPPLTTAPSARAAQ